MPIVAIIGPSGAGKSTLVDMYLAVHPDAILHKSVTTRPIRDSDDTSHNFVTDAEFDTLERENTFIYSTPAYGFRYGMPALPNDSGDIIFVLLRAQYIPKFKHLYPTTRVIQIEAQIDILMERLANRNNTDRIDEIAIRDEIKQGKDIADIIISTDNNESKSYQIFCAKLTTEEH